MLTVMPFFAASFAWSKHGQGSDTVWVPMLIDLVHLARVAACHLAFCPRDLPTQDLPQL